MSKKGCEMKNKVVIIDVDGVLNKYSNRKFYAGFILQVAKSLRHLRPNRYNILKSIVDFKKSGSHGLFQYIRHMSRNEREFNRIINKISDNLKYQSLPQDKQLCETLRQTAKNNKIIIWSDGLSSVARRVWDRVVGDEFKDNVTFCGIDDIKFRSKCDKKAWEELCKKYNIDASRAYLIDDCKNNLRIARSQGFKIKHVHGKNSLISCLTEINNNDNDNGTDNSILLRQMQLRHLSFSKA